MKFGEYVCSKAVTLCFLGIGTLLLDIFLAVTEVALAFIFALTVAIGVMAALWLVAGFLIEKDRIQRLEQVVNELPEKYLLGEVIPKPVHAVEYRYYEIMKEVSQAAIAAVEKAEREKEEYCEYVESWIHEMRTPLTACSLILDRAKETGGCGEAWAGAEEAGGYGETLDRIETGAECKYSFYRVEDVSRKLRRELKRADNLTESILYYARMRRVGNETQIRKVRAAELIREALWSQMELLTAAGISAEVTGDFEVYTDGKTVCFLLKQLLINCAKYCPGCHICISAKTGKITVKDNGIGIPSHELRRVTERGYTGSNGKRLGGSTGMGLYIVKELCSRLEIGLELASVEGSYTRIALIFPCREKTRT